MENKQILKTRKYKAGYEIRTEIWEHNGDTTEMKSAYNLNGDYIGNSKIAYFLCKQRGIKPEKANPNHNVCSIGFNEEEQKWYGWSHRAIFGFGIGSTVKLGDCAFIPKNKEEYVESLKLWYADMVYPNVKFEIEDDCLWISHDNSKVKEKYLFSDMQYGKGEWTAKTLEDAKQMAKDFASEVS